jgi:hypothetical protein
MILLTVVKGPGIHFNTRNGPKHYTVLNVIFCDSPLSLETYGVITGRGIVSCLRGGSLKCQLGLIF